MVSGGMRLRMLRRGGRFLLAKPSFFSALRRIFSKFRRFYRERGEVIFISVLHFVRQALSLLAVRFGRC